MIKTIFFDIGGVLLNIHPYRTLRYLCEKTGLDKSVIESLLVGEIHHAYERGELTDSEFYKQVKACFPHSNHLTEADFFHAWLQLLGEPTDTMDLALSLIDKYSVWLTSNTNPYHIQNGLQGVFDKFTGCIYSYEIGVRKPYLTFFKTALKISDAKAESTLFIDDNIDNIKGAQVFGLNTILYENDAQMKKDLTRLLSPGD
ncbi:MAG: HAD family phosphatase [Candidatus Marinimicrobia bacterium]|nr:HAD family phosphatase [Candidatus Neomarinimicrobiota bacterium]